MELSKELKGVFCFPNEFLIPNESFDKAFNRFQSIIFFSAEKWTPKGKQCNFKPFWNEKLKLLKREQLELLKREN